jgi:hypothetical protein
MVSKNLYERYGDRLVAAAQIGRLRRAMEVQSVVEVAANNPTKLCTFSVPGVEVGYVAVQVQPGQPVPVVARFAGDEPGLVAAWHNFVTAAVFEQILAENESLYVVTPTATRLLVQVVSL